MPVIRRQYRTTTRPDYPGEVVRSTAGPKSEDVWLRLEDGRLARIANERMARDGRTLIVTVYEFKDEGES